MFQKGVPSIPHDYKDPQYLCLLRLHGLGLQEFHTKMAQGYEADWCRKQLRDKGDKTVKALPDVPDDVSGEHSDHDIAPVLVPRAPLLALQDGEFGEMWARAKVSVPGSAEHRVVMDHGTQASGRQRAYIVCRHSPHGHCVHWRECHLYATRKEFMAYMLAWALSAEPHADRQEHMASEPDETMVQRALADIIVTDY